MATCSTEAVEQAVQSAELLLAQEEMRDAVDVPESKGGAATAVAVAHLGGLFEGLPRIIRHAFDRTRDCDGNLSSDPLQGLSEIVQNAEDLGDSGVRLLTRERDLLAGTVPGTVRIILEPLKHLPYRTSGNVLVSGIRSAQSLAYPFESTEQASS
ncbi:hypothetical protein ACH414_29095 [Streptomyces sp. NPDC020422]|uniref:hypothetical protein n=1 Tax=Streptomyces TaxID=1883 RepID=UPI0037B22027